MADAISKLYAELGFKVNQDGLKQVQSILKDFTKQINELNKATQDAAAQFGIFSKNNSKQELENEKIATQRAKTEEVRTRTAIRLKNQEAKEKIALDKAEVNSELKKQKEKEKIERDAQRAREKSARENKKLLSSIGQNVKSVIGDIIKTSSWVTGALSSILGPAVTESLGRSVSTRDFMMATGANLSDIQNVVERFASIGESVDQNTIMSDLMKLSQSMANVALKGDNLDAYKLLNTAIRRGDISGMLQGIGMAGQGIDNDFFVNLLGSIGLPSYWLSFFKAQGGGRPIKNFITEGGRQKIELATDSIKTLQVSFKNLSDWITAAMSPKIIEITGRFQKWNEDMSEAIQGESGTKLSALLKRFADDIIHFLDTITPERIYNGITTFFNALLFLAEKMVKIASWFGFKTEAEKKEEAERYASMPTIQESLRSGRIEMENFRPTYFNPRPGIGRSVSQSMSDSRTQTINIYGGDFEDVSEGFGAMDGPKELNWRDMFSAARVGGNTSG